MSSTDYHGFMHHLLAKRVALFLFLLGGSFLVVSPFLFGLPTPGLDPAWQLALNYAIAKDWQFGKDIVFTFGPYAPVYTGLYGPEVFWRKVAGSFIVVLAISLSMFALLKDQPRSAMKAAVWLMALGLVCFTGPRDWFAVLPLLIYLSLDRPKDNSYFQLANTAAGIAALCLISLIKGTLFLSSIGALALLFFSSLPPKRKISIWLGYVLGVAVLWFLAGQRLENLVPFFSSWIAIMSGYGEAMSNQANVSEVFSYVFIALATCWVFFKRQPTNVPSLLVLAVTLYVGFKAGYTRHDSLHTLMAGAILLLCVGLVFILTESKGVIATFVATVFFYGYMVTNYFPDYFSKYFPLRTPAAYHFTPYSATTSLEATADYLKYGTFVLQDKYIAALDEIRQKNPVVSVAGDADIYSYRQDLLIANGVTWNPRPVFQSFAAYNERLAELNARHLDGNAPQNILFGLEPIDGRLPALEDGNSWPLILANYRPVGEVGPYLHYVRNASGPSPAKRLLKSVEFQLGDEVEIPDAGLPVWAEVEIQPSLLGRIVNVAYKLPQLRIALKLAAADHAVRDYRYIRNIGASGFLISPVVETTSDFRALRLSTSSMQEKRANSMRIYSTSNWLFSEKATVHFFVIDQKR